MKKKIDPVDALSDMVLQKRLNNIRANMERAARNALLDTAKEEGIQLLNPMRHEINESLFKITFTSELLEYLSERNKEDLVKQLTQEKK